MLDLVPVVMHGSRHQRLLLEPTLYKTMAAVEMVSRTAPSMKLHRTLQITGARHPSRAVMLTDTSKHTKVFSARSLHSHTFSTMLYCST